MGVPSSGRRPPSPIGWEKECFMGRKPRVVTAFQPWANFFCPVGAGQFGFARILLILLILSEIWPVRFVLLRGKSFRLVERFAQFLCAGCAL